MSTPNDEFTIQRTLTVPVPVDTAFSHFAEKLATWWPAEYTWAQDVLQHIAIEPGVDGRCFERGPHGFECDWGRVLVWDPPRRLVFTWQISPHREPVPDPAKASEIEVTFQPDGANMTRVDFEHRHIDRHRDGAVEYRTMMASPDGWPYILNRYARTLTAP